MERVPLVFFIHLGKSLKNNLFLIGFDQVVGVHDGEAILEILEYLHSFG